MYFMNAWDLTATNPWMIFLVDVPSEVKDSDEVAYSVLRVALKQAPPQHIIQLRPEPTSLPAFDDKGIMISYGANAFSAMLVRTYPLDPEGV